MDARFSNTSMSTANQANSYSDAQGNTGQKADHRRSSLDQQVPKGQPIRESRGMLLLCWKAPRSLVQRLTWSSSLE